MEDIEHDEMEISQLENSLLQAEYKYRADITLLQQGLLRTKRMDNLHLILLHLKFQPLYRATKRLPVQYLFYLWKSKCSIDRTNRVKKVGKLLRYIYTKNMTRAFLLFRERGNRFYMERIINPGFRNMRFSVQDL